MTRRRFIAIVSLCVLAMLGTIVLGTGLFITRSDYGREWLRNAVEAQLAGAVKGKVHLGRISGSFLTGVKTRTPTPGVQRRSLPSTDDSVGVAV